MKATDYQWLFCLFEFRYFISALFLIEKWFEYHAVCSKGQNFTSPCQSARIQVLEFP